MLKTGRLKTLVNELIRELISFMARCRNRRNLTINLFIRIRLKFKKITRRSSSVTKYY